MDKIKHSFSSVINFLIVALFLLSKLGAIAIYVWSIVLAWNVKGFVAAIITAIIPVLSQLYWAYKAYVYVGFWNNYILAILAYLVLWIIIVLLKIVDGFISNES